MGLNPAILSALDKLWYTTPTKIQEEVIRISAEWNNIIGQSQTWTWKTWAFVISILQKIDLTKRGTKALILAPTRELVTQIKEEIFNLSTNMRIRSLAVYGWEAIYKQIKMIDKGQDIIIGTPWRVIDLIERRVIKTDDIEFFVLDEVDRMLDMWFVDDIEFVWSNLKNIKQALAFSATITPEIKWIVEKYLWVDYTFIKATSELTVAKIDHSFVDVPSVDKFDMLKKFILKHKSDKTIVFVDTKRDTEILANKLLDEWFEASYLNWDMRQRERFKALKDFQENKTKIFVVTDVAARGLNIKNIDLVINYHVPQDPESYIHRIGRTWRAWAEGRAIMMVSASEKYAFKNIEKRNKIKIKQIDEHWEEVERIEERTNSRSWWRNDRNWYNRFERRPARSWYSRWDARSDSRNSRRWEEKFSSRENYSSSSSSWRSRQERDDKATSNWYKSAYFEKKQSMFGDRKPFEKRDFEYGDRKSFSSRWNNNSRSRDDRNDDRPNFKKDFQEKKSFWNRDWFERRDSEKNRDNYIWKKVRTWDRSNRDGFERRDFEDRPKTRFNKSDEFTPKRKISIRRK